MYVHCERSVAVVAGHVSEAAADGAQLAVFPESFMPGYADWAWRHTHVWVALETTDRSASGALYTRRSTSTTMARSPDSTASSSPREQSGWCGRTARALC